jgi:peptidyl-prolyl cis-trans isomerase SDCCAG10
MPDIEPRITGAEKRQQEKARKEARKNAAKGRRKKEGVKNKSLMSFEEEEEAGGSGATVKITSAHDALNDPSLSKEVLSRRGLPGAMPEGFGERPSQHDSLTQKRKADQLDGSSNGQRAGSESAKPWDSAAFATKVDRNGSSSSAATKQLEGYLAGNKKRKESATGPTSESDRVRAEIAKVQADLKKMTRKDKGSDDEDGAATKSKKAKESGAALLAAERAKYSQGGRKLGKAGEGKGKKRAEEDEDLMSMLDGFRSRVRAAVVEGVQTSSEPATDAAAATDGYAGEILEEQFDDNDGGWLGHALQFRKDATMDQHSIDEYEVVDPREKGMTLEDAKREDERRKRKTQQGRGDGGRTRDAERQIDRRDRGGPNSNRARERY